MSQSLHLPRRRRVERATESPAGTLSMAPVHLSRIELGQLGPAHCSVLRLCPRQGQRHLHHRKSPVGHQQSQRVQRETKRKKMFTQIFLSMSPIQGAQYNRQRGRLIQDVSSHHHRRRVFPVCSRSRLCHPAHQQKNSTGGVRKELPSTAGRGL